MALHIVKSDHSVLGGHNLDRCDHALVDGLELPRRHDLQIRNLRLRLHYAFLKDLVEQNILVPLLLWVPLDTLFPSFEQVVSDGHSVLGVLVDLRELRPHLLQQLERLLFAVSIVNSAAEVNRGKVDYDFHLS